MANGMKVAEIQAKVKETVFNEIANLFAENGEQFGDFEIAVPVTVENVERWAKVSVVCGQLKDTKTSKAFDPFVARENWELDKEYKKNLAESKAKAKADKLAKAKSKDNA
jgi:predicted protein tyrosine phosphatase